MRGKAIILVGQYPAAGIPDGFRDDVAKRAGDRVVRPENREVSLFEQRKVKGGKWTCMPKPTMAMSRRGRWRGGECSQAFDVGQGRREREEIKCT